jgi:hypothetical protein
MHDMHSHATIEDHHDIHDKDHDHEHEHEHQPIIN